MRGTPFTKSYPGNQRKMWDRFDRLPKGYREMVASDPDGNMVEILEVAENLARKAGLLPPLPEEEGLSKKELRAQRDRERTKAAKARSRIVYKIPAGSYVFKKDPLPEEEVVVAIVKINPRSKSEHNS